MTVGPEHAIFKACAGTWNVASKMWFGPGEPQVGKAKQVCKTILGGLGASFEYHTISGPMAMLGHGTVVWNPLKKVYETMWVDNYSYGGMSRGTGVWDAAKKTMTETMTSLDHTGQEQVMTLVTTHESADKLVSVFSMPGPDGKPMRFMELTYVRTKGKR